MTRKNHLNAGRKALFLPDLDHLLRATLPDAPDANPRGLPRERIWRTTRLRPEIMAALDGLGLRFQANTGRTITYSEMLAALMLIALPRLTETEAFRRPSTPASAAAALRIPRPVQPSGVQ